MHESTLLRILSVQTVLWLVYDFVAAQSPDVPRWGQAASLVQHTLYVHGGRTDQYNSFAYTSAPVSNDLLTLDLSSPFNISSPPWTYDGGCSTCSASQGPAVAWHTLSAFNVSSLLLFGGDPGPNSPIVLPERNDSAVLLELNGRNASWDFVADSWANEPLRRIHHSASLSQDKIWIVGGQKTDGSGNAFSDHYVFDPTVPSFTQLLSTGGPPDVVGHTSVVLPNGQLLVFGGYSPSQQSLVPLSTVWVLDTTQSDANWSTLPVASSSVPPSRRDFAATLLDNGKVVIHGGADATLQSLLSDGWILDTTQTPMQAFRIYDQWPSNRLAAICVRYIVEQLSAQLHTSPCQFITSSYDATRRFSDVGSGSPSGSPGGSQPSQPQSSSPGSNNGSAGGGGKGEGDGGGGNSGSSTDSGSHTTAIAVGTVFGVIGLMLGTTVAMYYVRRRHRSQQFHLLGPSDDEGSPHLGHVIPVAGINNSHEKGLPLPPVVKTVKDRLVGMMPGGTVRNVPGRRDMLADEDTREFEEEWWMTGGMRRDPSSGRSSLRRPTLGDKVYGSLASLRSVGGAMLDYAAAAPVVRSLRKEGSGGSRSIWTRSEKEASDPFGDDWGLVRAKRMGRLSESRGYVDPFEDYEVQSVEFDADAPPYFDDDDDDEGKGYPRLNDPPPRPYLHTAYPPSVDLTHLTPVSEQPSLSTLTESANTSTDASRSNPSLTLSGAALASSSSHDTPRSPTQRPSSLIDAYPSTSPPSSPMSRSNSWWVRFAKTPLLDRRNSDAARQGPLDFRDPNPPPSRLVPIEEAASPTASKRGSSGGHHQLWSSHAHARSASSLQTARTADSEALERMGQMDIVQKGSHGTDQSSSGGEPGRPAAPVKLERPLSVVTAGSEHSGITIDNNPIAFVLSPESTVPQQEEARPGRQSPRKRSPTGNVVSERVQAFERRMSQQEDFQLKSPPPARSKLRTSVYGVVPKAPLYVTNPDRERSGSGDS
ncbi:hypothetical protein EUX98_g4262 [Antrodiella citrinella]|uniref:Galactose oxidase n=1 Tax=Antrodiella citrinella TaxID=2447956 RepID=A0A4V3XIN7_9APHY|nr:hypothetical protein EUX98_g4262 [Antrodiella citrinella]